MTITITCQYTGISFEASSKRSKNHPLVSELLNSASRDKHNAGRYSTSLTALKRAREAGMTDIHEVIAFVDRFVAGDIEDTQRVKRAEAEAMAAANRQREAAKQARKEQNTFLRSHGYTWSKEFADRDEYESGDDPSLWALFAPDGRSVPPSQAMDEIARGVEVVLAEVAQREAVEAAAKAAADAAKQIEQDAQEAVKVEFETACANATKGMTAVAGGGIRLDQLQKIASHVESWRTRILNVGTVNGTPVAVIESYTYDSDNFSSYCADPVAAGLTALAKPQAGSLSETLSNFFGKD